MVSLAYFWLTVRTNMIQSTHLWMKMKRLRPQSPKEAHQREEVRRPLLLRLVPRLVPKVAITWTKMVTRKKMILLP